MTNRRVVAAAVITVLMWASSFVVIRGVADAFSPAVMAFLRMLVGAVALSVMAAIVRVRIPRGRALVLVLAYGALWFGFYTMVLNWAERHLDAGTAALLVNFAPILVAAVAGVVFAEGFPPPLILGMIVAFTGVVVIGLGDGSSSGDLLGVGLGLLAAVLYASGVLLQKVALRTVDSTAATWLGCLTGLVVTSAFAVPSLGAEVSQAGARQLILVAFLGLGPTALAFTTWAYVLRRSTAGATAAMTLSVPAIAILLSWVTLGEVPTPVGLVGGVLCLLGVAISRMRTLPGARHVRRPGHADVAARRGSQESPSTSAGSAQSGT